MIAFGAGTLPAMLCLSYLGAHQHVHQQVHQHMHEHDHGPTMDEIPPSMGGSTILAR